MVKIILCDDNIFLPVPDGEGRRKEKMGIKEGNLYVRDKKG